MTPAFALSAPPRGAAARASAPRTCAPVMTLHPHISRRAALLSAAAAGALAFLPPALAQSTGEAGLRAGVAAAVARDPTLAGTLLRLAFHDAFTADGGRGGANGSIRLETGRGANSGLARAVDALQPLVADSGLSWGDAVAVAGAAAVEACGGPRITFTLGRGSADGADPDGLLPGFDQSVGELEADFGKRGLGKRDLVALSGAHTLGVARGSGPFVAQPNVFGNDYFRNLKWFADRADAALSTRTGPPDRPNFQLQSDVALLDDPDTRAIVLEFAADQAAFFDAFVASYRKMVDIGA